MKKIIKICAIGILLVACNKHEVRETKYEDGQPEEMFYVKQTNDGSFARDGEYTYWYEDGQAAEKGQYKNGLKTGEWRLWYKNGQLNEIENYLKDSLHGKTERWYLDGEKAFSGEYKSGKAFGEWKSWFKNGNSSMLRYYNEHGNLHGLLSKWYDNGQIKLKENYIDGKKEGESMYWDSEGTLVYKRFFQNDIDTNFPAKYVSTSGESLELLKDQTFKLRYLKDYWFESRWTTAVGDFLINEGELDLDDFNEYEILKYNYDTLELEDDILFIRQD